MPRACQPLVLSALLALLLVPAARAAEGRTAYQVRDLANRDVLEGISLDRQFFPLGNRIVFRAGGRVAGQELWASDGTPHGTELLVDACPGSCGSALRILGTLRGRLYWLSSSNGLSSGGTWRLWTTDGTRAGTRPLTHPSRVLPDGDESGPFAFTGSFLYFAACAASSSSSSDCGLWRSDGTAVTRIEGAAATFRRVSGLTAVGDRVFVSALDAQSRGGLWVSDGTPDGTVRLAAFPAFDSPHHLATAGNLAFFAADAGEGDELWASDGTVAGTRAVTRFAPAEPFPTFSDFAFEDWFLRPAGNLVYFVANDVLHEDELWRSDGTLAGTFAVTDVEFHAPFGDNVNSPARFQPVGGRLLFRATDGLSGMEWWVSAGTRATTRPLQDECPSCQLPPFASEMFPGNGRVIFSATLASGDRAEVWTSDGTARGTRPLPDPCPGLCGALFGDLVPSSGGVFYRVFNETAPDLDLWFTDGTPAGTKRLTRVGSSSLSPDESPAARTANGKFFFLIRHDFEDESHLFVSDGTPASARPVVPLERFTDSSSPRRLVAQGERLFFLACAPGDGLWQTTGSAESTFAVSGPNDHCDSFDAPFNLIAAGSSLFYFTRGPGSEGFDLWRTDGTPAGTVRLTSLPPGTAIDPESAVASAGRLYFGVEVQSPRRSEVWVSDGTPQGTVKAFELPADNLESLHAVGDELYLVVPFSGGGVFRSDGTQAGTREIASNPRGGREPRRFVRLGSQVYFNSSSDFGKPEIWQTDGTSFNTFAAVTLPEPGDALPWELTAHQGALFVADDGEHGAEVWRSDGTAAGTALLRDIMPGSGGSSPASLVAAGDRLFFVATDLAHGTELWQSDGTAAGTRLAHDIAPLASSSSPAELTVAGDRLYFSADDSLTGRELWAFPLSAAGCQPSPIRLCLGGGRFAVEATWRDFQDNTGAGQAVPLSADTGYFWFFDAANVETIVKVLDGQGLNGHHWVFYGALSSVEYTLTVTDLLTGLTRRYLSPSGVLASVGDTQGFGPLGAFARVPQEVVASPAPAVLAGERVDPAAATGSCQPGPRRLCLQGGRFAVEATWRDFQNRTGAGTAVPLTPDTGYFWFFDAANVEVVAKVLDGTALNGKLWFFYGALSNVEYRITVTDTATGTVKTYDNPSGRFGSVGDTGAF